MNVEAIVLFLSTEGADFALKILAALAAWIIGRWVIGLLLRGFGSLLERGKRVDATLANYLRSILGVMLNIVLALAAPAVLITSRRRSVREITHV